MTREQIEALIAFVKVDATEDALWAAFGFAPGGAPLEEEKARDPVWIAVGHPDIAYAFAIKNTNDGGYWHTNTGYIVAYGTNRAAKRKARELNNSEE